MTEHRSPLRDSFQRAASELVMDERERGSDGDGNEEGEARADR